MPRKTLMRIEEGATATSVAYSCATLLDAGLAQQVGEASSAEEGLDCGGSLAVRIARKQELLRHQLEAASEYQERVEDSLKQERKRRQQAAEKLHFLVKKLRGLCLAVFVDKEGDVFLGLSGSLPRKPKAIHALAGSVLRRLADPEWELPEKELESWEFGREGIVKTVSKAYRELGDALTEVKEWETREKIAKAGKRRAALAHNTFLDKSARYLEAALDLAGLDDLVATVRPNVGRRGRPSKELDGSSAGDVPALAAASAANTSPAELPAEATAPVDAPAHDESSSAD